ncbi:MAG: tetratricopeptide repeat protein [Caldilineaceae bacterium]|nr:tetratricopeptide repeat protein [Caldilineaceae bacterium]
MDNLEPLLQTKFYIPPPRPDLISRPRLLERLDTGLQAKLMLISAPPGFGKSTLLGDWIAQRNLQERTAWLSLDEGDNDPVRFWRYVIGSLQRVQPEIGRAAQGLFPSLKSPSLESVVTSLINEITAFPQPFFLVLDDYHLIEKDTIHESLLFLLDHQPPQLHLAITTRADPPLPLARLRVRGSLVEIRTADLRFAPEEARSYLHKTANLDLSPDQIDMLGARTEGWIAGLQLATLSMQGYQDFARFIATFTGSHRYIIDYLSEEVLQRQPASLQSFLLQTSILDRFCAPLCDAITERSEGQQTLVKLEQDNLFLIPLDDERRWYRYHHLFADLLRSRLDVEKSDHLRSLHRRAGEWFEAQNLYSEAVHHFIAAQVWESAAALIERLVDSLWMHGEVNLLLAWLNPLPADLVHRRPRLCLAHAWVSLYNGPLDAVEGWLHRAEQTVSAADSEILGEIAAIRASTATIRGEAEQATAFCTLALQLLPLERRLLRAATVHALGTAYRVSGNIGAALQAYTEAVTVGRASNHFYLLIDSLCNLGLIQMARGQLHLAHKSYLEALARVEADHGPALPIAGEVYIVMGDLLREWNRLDEAESYLRRGLTLGEQGGIVDLIMTGYFWLARIKQAQSDFTQALDLLHRATQLAQRHQIHRLISLFAAQEARLLLVTGQLDAAMRWAHSYAPTLSESTSYMRDSQITTLARVWFAHGRSAQALHLLDHLYPVVETSGRMSSVIEIQLLRALVLSALGDVEASQQALTHSLTLAEPQGYLRRYLDEGQPVADLLQRTSLRDPHLRAYRERLLSLFGEGEPQPAPLLFAPTSELVEPLTSREVEILRLIAAGRTNQEIAQQLVVQPSTIKKHINNIFGKLGATHRTQAVALAHEFGLL